ncbi:UNVERIFIED_ORG: hypothetical protein ABID33_000535 [Xanthobacter viscosus]|uniref:Uncharacterized protein n=1 Tax=Xanthobacter autotrophicus TaxID=280 RepID=A0A6C1KHD4_XANAU|nr:hypothetical protein [Xanthobacter autotrophicus]TLX43600.1 hypothetical protein FBQ73_05640 [Xanthobacter autotrophicus]
MISLDAPTFLDFDRLQRAIWSPVLFRPIMGSPEQFVIGIAVAGENGVHLERANQLRRLECVFSDASEMAIMVAETALNVIEADLFRRSTSALTDFKPAISGVLLGDLREAQGISLKQIAVSWMTAMSSLYTRNGALQLSEEQEEVLEEVAEARESGDRLPALVFEYVQLERPNLGRFFSNEIRSGQQRRRNAHSVIIDFAGSKLVANFGTLASSNFTASVRRIKTRLWDLKVDRDREPSALVMRDHEMIVQHPAMNDPQLSQKQVDRLREALEALEAQADQEEIRLRPLNRVDEIGKHILLKEAA